MQNTLREFGTPLCTPWGIWHPVTVQLNVCQRIKARHCWSARLFSQWKIPRNSDKGWERHHSETSKKFLLVDGVLHYKQSVKGGEQRLWQVHANNLHCHGCIKGEQNYLMIMHCVTMYYLSSMSGYQRQSDKDKKEVPTKTW